MRTPILILGLWLLAACNSGEGFHPGENGINAVLERNWEERMPLFPTEATQNGDNR